MFFTIDGQNFLQTVFDIQFQCYGFIFSGVNEPIYCRTWYILSLVQSRHGSVKNSGIKEPSRALCGDFGLYEQNGI